MGTTNADAGRTGIRIITDKSLYLKEFCKVSANGRKPLVSNEQFDFSRENLVGMTFVDTSNFFLLPVIYPEIYFNNNDKTMRQAIKGYMNYLCTTCRAVDGFQDITLGKETPTFKSRFFTIPHFTKLDNPTQELSFTIPAETSGYFMTELTRHWMNAISDEQSGIAHYNGYREDYNNYSHSAAVAYIKPNKTYTRVDWGCLIFMMVPVSAPYSNYNADATSPRVPELQLQFSCSIMDTRISKVNETLTSLLLKWANIVVADSGDYGEANRTYLHLPEEVNEDLIFGNVVIG